MSTDKKTRETPKEKPEKSGKDQLEKKTKDFLAQIEKQGIDAKTLAAIIKNAMDGG
jgi:DNA-binding transcriptional regulator YhcF (GntR family)